MKDTEVFAAGNHERIVLFGTGLAMRSLLL